MKNWKPYIFVAIIVSVSIVTLRPNLVHAQTVGTTIQLPVIRNFQINTVVSVPDGGTMSLGGSTSATRYSRRRPSYRSHGRSVASPGVSVSANLIIGSEIEAELQRRGRIAIAERARPDIHGTVKQKSKALFLARNLGRGLK
jgi:hypothetical protein